MSAAVKIYKHRVEKISDTWIPVRWYGDLLLGFECYGDSVIHLQLRYQHNDDFKDIHVVPRRFAPACTPDLAVNMLHEKSSTMEMRASSSVTLVYAVVTKKCRRCLQNSTTSLQFHKLRISEDTFCVRQIQKSLEIESTPFH